MPICILVRGKIRLSDSIGSGRSAPPVCLLPFYRILYAVFQMNKQKPIACRMPSFFTFLFMLVNFSRTHAIVSTCARISPYFSSVYFVCLFKLEHLRALSLPNATILYIGDIIFSLKLTTWKLHPFALQSFYWRNFKPSQVNCKCWGRRSSNATLDKRNTAQLQQIKKFLAIAFDFSMLSQNMRTIHGILTEFRKFNHFHTINHLFIYETKMESSGGMQAL